MNTTLIVCGKCGLTTEADQAQDWLVAQRADAPEGHLIIRCPEHITEHARRLAGLPQQNRTKRVEDNLDRGLWVEYGDGYSANAYEYQNVEDGGYVHYYVLSFHKGEMPAFNSERFDTIPSLVSAMRKVEPDLRKWHLTEID